MKALLGVVVFAFAPLCRAASFTELVAFGDSLSDIGNRGLAPNKTNITFRQTWVAQLAGPSLLNIPDFKPSGMTAYYGGTDYAVGGAGTEYTAKSGSSRNSGQNLTQQVSKRYLNPTFNTQGVKTNALHVIVIGANDLMLASIAPEQILSLWAELDKTGASVAQSAEGQIQALASAGVAHVLWGNVFDVAQTPSVVSRSKLLGEAVSATYRAALTKAVLAHNREMDLAIERLEKANPALTIIKLDLFSTLADIVAAPSKYGFSDVTRGENDSRHLFSADGLHPTTQGHRVLAEYAFGLLTSAVARPAK